MTPTQKAIAEIKARLEKAFDTDEANKIMMAWVDKFYPNRFEDHDDYNTFIGFGVYGMRYVSGKNKSDIEKLLKEREILVGALEKYADKVPQVHISKIEQDPEVGEFVHREDFETIMNKDWCGTFSGKIARQAQKEAEEVWLGLD